MKSSTKKIIVAAGASVMAVCMAVSLTACGPLSEAKRIRGEEVSAAEWKSAVSETQFSASGAAGTAKSLAAAVEDETAELPNFSISYEMSAEGGWSLESELRGEGSADVDIGISASIIDAENRMHATLRYSYKMSGSEEVMQLLGRDSVDEKGKIELFAEYTATGVTYYLQGDDGEWSAKASLAVIPGLSSSMIDEVTECLSLADCSMYADAFEDFEYSDEDMGYSLKGGLDGGDLFGSSASLIIKIKDGELAAVVSECGFHTAILGLTASGASERGFVYEYGGQTVELPQAAQ